MNKQARRKIPNKIVALIYAPNSCYTKVVRPESIEGLQIIIWSNTWRYKDPRDEHARWVNKKIGECDYLMKNKSRGVIGVYDTSSVEQLTSMVRHSQEMTTEDRGFDD
jgi:hypothetical protein